MTVPITPFLSVVVPVYQGSSVLDITLSALVASDLARSCWELIVVDDGSTDDSAFIAARYADTVVKLPGRKRGPAYARNRGFEVARGACVVFLDADVRVHTDTLRALATVMMEDPDVSAVFGSYDADPPATGLASQYRNLLHHYVHQQSPGDAETFWAGCGAVRSSTFAEAGMYDEWHFSRPQVEDIELGHRIRALGRRIVLRPEIQVTHLKKWTLKTVMVTDLRDRGVPWMRLLLHQGIAVRTRTLNLRTIEKFNTALVWLSLISACVSLLSWKLPWLILAATFLVPPLVSNRGLYIFLTRRRGLLFGLGSIPLHLVYYLSNGVSALLGSLLHGTIGAPVPDPTVEAYAEVGLQTWPPIPTRRHSWDAPVAPGK
ncbi:MAG: glycosyltransferase family 2 protein [Gemmatimonadaceae bacterium]